MSSCTICHKPLVLRPSANERAQRYGGTAQQYTDLFTSHNTCFIAKRAADTLELIRRIK